MVQDSRRDVRVVFRFGWHRYSGVKVNFGFSGVRHCLFVTRLGYSGCARQNVIGRNLIRDQMLVSATGNEVRG